MFGNAIPYIEKPYNVTFVFLYTNQASKRRKNNGIGPPRLKKTGKPIRDIDNTWSILLSLRVETQANGSYYIYTCGTSEDTSSCSMI